MSKPNTRIFIVDDDAKFGKSLARLVTSIGFEVETFLSAKDFLEKTPYEGISCLLLDVRMPGLTGPDLQRELIARKISMPIIFLTAHGDTTTGVKAMKDGAVDFLLKPVEETVLFDVIDKALNKDIQLKKQQNEVETIKHRLAKLTPREMEVLRCVIAGMLNKQIASSLGAKERTIKAHRSQVMQKLDVDSVAELVRQTEKAGISPAKAKSSL